MRDAFTIMLDILSFVAMQVTAQSFTEPITSSLTQFGQGIVEALPKIIAALILLGIGLLVGRIIGWVVKKVVEKMNVDKYWNRTTIGQSISQAGWRLSRILTVAARWFVYLFFISAAVNALEFQQVSEAINSVWLWIPNVAAFIIILVIGGVIADFVGKWMQRELPARGVVGGRTIAMGATGILYAVILVVATSQLGIGQQILNSVISALVWGIAAAVAIGLGVGMAYGLKEMIPSMIRGSTQIQPAIKPGQRITLNGHAGTVEQAGAYNIILRNDQGKRVVIPTKSVADKEIVIESGPRPETQESAAAMAEGRTDYTSSTAPAA
jgi:hypothetical protein